MRNPWDDRPANPLAINAAALFTENFNDFESEAAKEVIAAGPKTG